LLRNIKLAFRRLRQRLFNRSPIGRELFALKAEVERIRESNAQLLALGNAQYNNFAFHSYYSLLAASPRLSDERRLTRYGQSVNSQNGEDGILNEIFRRIGRTDRVFVEIGVGDGLENNSAFLLAQGWRGYWVDGNDSFVERIAPALVGRGDRLQWRVRFVDRENIAATLDEMSVPQEFDLLSLDVDQNTYYLWEGLAARRPRVVVVEYNAAIPPDVDWKVEYAKDRVWDGSQNYGASLKAFENLAAGYGYSLVGCDFNGVNAFFVRDDLIGGHFAAPYSSENHHEPPRYTIIHREMHRRGMLDLPR